MVKIKNLQMAIEEAWSYGLRDKLLAIITMANRGCNYPPSIKEGEIANAVLAFIMDNIDVLIKKRNELAEEILSKTSKNGDFSNPPTIHIKNEEIIQQIVNDN